MGEADWWLCASCSSLNNLAARKCYSCGERKPKAAVRASEYLGYRPVVSWDGKVKLEQLTAEELRQERDARQAPEVESSSPPPLREPERRDTLVVAPRPPHPARITYRLDEPAPAPPPSLPPLWSTPTPPPVAMAPPAAGVPPGAMAPPGRPGVGSAPGQPMVPVGPGPDPAARPAGQQWPHWRELLDGPVPHAERLRTTASADAAAGMRSNLRSQSDGMTLRSAIRLARTGDAREFVAWPEADRLPQEDVADERPAPSADPRPPE